MFSGFLGTGNCYSSVMAEEIVEQLRRFSLTPEEEDDIVIDASVRERAIVDCSASLVGKLLTKRGFSRAALKDTMRKVWGSPEGLRMVDVGENLFHFRFSNEMDLQRVVNGGPWCFDNMVLLLRRWEAGMKADTVIFNEIDFWIQLWGLPFECITREIGEVIGRRIGVVLEVNKVTEKGDWGRYVRVRVRIPLNRPLRRGGNILLGEGMKCWVDYKYERLPCLCHYCGMLDHEIRECPSKSKDVMEGCIKENSYGPWMAAASSFRRGYKWMERNEGYQKRWRGEVGSSNKLDLVTAADVVVGAGNRDGRACDGNGKDKAEPELRASRLIDVADNSVVAINGNQFRMGDLIPDFPQNLNITEARGGLISGPSVEVVSGSNTRADMSLDFPPNKAQVGLGRIMSTGPVFSFGSTKVLGSDVASGVIDPNIFVEAPVCNVPESDWGRKEKSVRVLPGSFRVKARGRKQGPNSKRKAPGSGKEDGGAVSFSQNAGKRRLDVLDSTVLAKQVSKRVFLGNISNTIGVEAADPNGPPSSQ